MTRHPYDDLAPTAAPRPDEDAIYRKVTLRLLPLLFVCYLVAFLDRINIGYAKLQMSGDLGFSDAAYGVGAGLFFLTYLVFEVPSNVLLERVGAKLTLLRIMVLWGVVSSATAFVRTPGEFYFLRLLLGVCEAGFFPGIILFLTYWFPEARRGRVTGLFMLAIPVAGVIGGPLSGAIMGSMDGLAGYRGWQWMLVLEGLPSIALGIIVYRVLANRPSEARWLDADEKRILEDRLAAERDGPRGGERHTPRGQLAAALLDGRVWLLAFIYFATASANYTFTFWLPTIIQGLGVTSVSRIGLYSAIPYIAAVAGILVITASSDRRRERRWHIGGSMLLGALGLGSIPFLGDSLWLTLFLLSATAFFQFAAGIAFWTIPSTYLDRNAAAVGIGIISSIGVSGGFVSPSLLGWIKDLTGHLDNGIFVIAGFSLLCAVLILAVVPSRALRVRTTAGQD